MLNDENQIWLVYDGECPLCSATAKAIKIRQSVGSLHIINARESHPILQEIQAAKLNLDEGMVVKYNGVLYHGADAQHILALIGSDNDWLNRMNVLIFRNPLRAKLIYPFLRMMRNLLLRIRQTDKLNNLDKHQ